MPGSDRPLRAIRRYLCSAQRDHAVRWAHLAGVGPVRALEEKLRRHYGTRFALAMSNATTALLACALALDLRDSEFVTTPFTYGATLAPFLLLGNRPLFADIDPDTMTLDPGSVRRKISRKTRAIVAVDVFGLPADTRALRDLADDLGLPYIGDAAQSLGAFIDGLPASGRAHVLVTSFTAGKPLFAGEGGALLTDLEDVYKKAILWTQHPHRQKRELALDSYNEFALNGRPHPLGAAWADVVFHESLQELTRYRTECFRLLRAAESTGLLDPLTREWRKRRILPAFTRVVARWAARPDPDRLVTALYAGGYRTTVAPCPLKLVYQQRSFTALYGHLAHGPVRCPAAERTVPRLLCLSPDRPAGSHLPPRQDSDGSRRRAAVSGTSTRPSSARGSGP